MIAEAVQWLCGVLAVPVAMGYLCRLGLFSLHEHKPSIGIMHACLFGGALYSLHRAFESEATGGDLLYLGGAAAWLAVSMSTWAHGVPRHFSRTVKH